MKKSLPNVEDKEHYRQEKVWRGERAVLFDTAEELMRLKTIRMEQHVCGTGKLGIKEDEGNENTLEVTLKIMLKCVHLFPFREHKHLLLA